MRFPDPRALLITGGSSGIGAALARAYARPGRRLTLTGRDAVRLESVAAACRAAGAEVVTETVPVTDAAGMAAVVAAAERAAPLDLVIANAGIGGGTAGGPEPEAQIRAMWDVNLMGVLNSVLPAIGPMRARGRGQVALMASLAGFRGYPGAPTYAASKAAVRVWGEGLRPLLRADGIGVSVICPGFVVSRMTDRNAFPMPFLMPAERAARIIVRGLAADRGRIAFPWPMAAGAWLLASVPPSWVDGLLARAPRKA